MPNYVADSTSRTIPAVIGTNTIGVGLEGVSNVSTGVSGHSTRGPGVSGHSEHGNGIVASSVELAGMKSSSVKGVGVMGIGQTGNGVLGLSDTGIGAVGESVNNTGVMGQSKSGTGVLGKSNTGTGIMGIAEGDLKTAVFGKSTSGHGVYGQSDGGTGVGAISITGEALHAHTASQYSASIAAYLVNDESSGAAIYAETTGNGVAVHAKGKTHAAFLDGHVAVTGNLIVEKEIFCKVDIHLTNADCAEDFDISHTDSVEPGTVMVLGEEGLLYQCSQPYDKCVAGVISGAGKFKPGIVLDKQPSVANRQPIALLGKVYCKVDAQFGSIDIGDMLTTSPTAGYAMKVSEPAKAFGAVIGKALSRLPGGKGLIPILIALQ